MYLEILNFKIYIKNCAKNKWEEQKETEEIITDDNEISNKKKSSITTNIYLENYTLMISTIIHSLPII